MAATAPSALACVLGRYALGDEIARGGMATVHLGLVLGEAGFARTVAVKRLLPGLARDPEFVASFVDEAKLASRVRHPNVVPTLDVLAQDGELFVVMEYVHGESLAGLIQAADDRGERIPVAVVSAILAGALQGLHAAHEAKDERGAPLHLVHRDVSPQNVLVGVDGVARVLDFGIAKAAGRAQITREGQVKGKLGYMAPEQLRQRAERASDIYASGVCLWEALTMRRLFSGDNESAVLAKILAGLAPRPSKYAAEVSPALDALTLRALHRDPGERFATAREMARALESAAPPAPISEVGEWVERLAAPGLARRGERVAAIEVGRAPEAAPPSPERRPDPAAPPDVSTRPALEAAPSPPRRGWAWLAWGGLGATLVTTALLASLPRDARANAPVAANVGGAPLSDVQPAHAETAEPAATSSGPAAPDPVDPGPTSPALAASSPSQIPAVARPRSRPGMAPRASCDPPYSVGVDGVRHYKKECLK